MSRGMTMTMHAPPTSDGSLALVGAAEPQFVLEAFDYDVANIEKIIDSLRYNGGVRVKGFLKTEDLVAAEAAVRPALDAAQYATAADPTKRLGRLPEHAPVLTEKILTDELYLAVMERFLSVDSVSWLGSKKYDVIETPIVAMTSIFEVGPGMHVQDLHRDDSIWYNKLTEIKPEEYWYQRDRSISFFVAGTKTTRANGATRFIPGSHLTKYDSQPDPSKTVDAELDAGDAFFMLSSCYHGAGGNTTEDEKRLVYALFMQQPQYRQEENLAMFLDHALVRSFPIDVQRRLGYDVALPNLGWVDHASPLESVLKQKGVDNRSMPGYNPVAGIADARAETSWQEAEATVNPSVAIKA